MCLFTRLRVSDEHAVGNLLLKSNLNLYSDTFIHVSKWGSFDFSDIDENEVRDMTWVTSVPDFVTNFERELDSKPGLTVNVCYYFLDLSTLISALTGRYRGVSLSTICPHPMSNLGMNISTFSRTGPPGTLGHWPPKLDLTKKRKGWCALQSHWRWPISRILLLVDGKDFAMRIGRIQCSFTDSSVMSQ